MTTRLRGGCEGDVGGRQGLVGVSLEALHSDVNKRVVGARGERRGFNWTDWHFIHDDLIAVRAQQGAGRVAFGDGGEREQSQGSRVVS